MGLISRLTVLRLFLGQDRFSFGSIVASDGSNDEACNRPIQCQGEDENANHWQIGHDHPCQRISHLRICFRGWTWQAFMDEIIQNRRPNLLLATPVQGTPPRPLRKPG